MSIEQHRTKAGFQDIFLTFKKYVACLLKEEKEFLNFDPKIYVWTSFNIIKFHEIRTSQKNKLR